MRKSKELADPNSCLNKAAPDELIFVILGRDIAAPAAIRAWAKERVKRGKNLQSDTQIKEAYGLAALIESKLYETVGK